MYRFYDLPRLEEYVDKRYKDHLKNQGKVDSVSSNQLLPTDPMYSYLLTRYPSLFSLWHEKHGSICQNMCANWKKPVEFSSELSEFCLSFNKRVYFLAMVVVVKECCKWQFRQRFFHTVTSLFSVIVLRRVDMIALIQFRITAMSHQIDVERLPLVAMLHRHRSSTGRHWTMARGVLLKKKYEC